jgi:hypothetical protein
MTDDEISKAARDAFTYGTGFMRDGKHVPLEDVYMTAKDIVADDLVKRLNMVDATMHQMTLVIVAREAAKRIEQLEAALREIVAMTPDPEFGTLPIESAIKVARAALKER